MEKYLESSKYIDWCSSPIKDLAIELSSGMESDVEIARRYFEWVRDNVKHSSDYELNPVTCIASDVLNQGTGFCFAKSHLLAALLRANEIPAGLCYQRLSIKDGGPPYCLHGLNAVNLKDFGWYRIDPRGNRSDIITSFSPPMEYLAFSTTEENEVLFPEIWPEPLPIVVEILEKYETFSEVTENLPDIEIARN